MLRKMNHKHEQQRKVKILFVFTKCLFIRHLTERKRKHRKCVSAMKAGDIYKNFIEKKNR